MPSPVPIISHPSGRSMLGLERYIGESELEHSLLELVRTRASQLNGRAFCLDIHSKDAIAAGETPQQLPSGNRVPLSRSRQSCFHR